MPTCDRCGEEIEFRHIDGRPTPIHLSGEWCVGFGAKKPVGNKGYFRSDKDFLDPNALCPVCGAAVFYYQNSFGSRVFFDDVGWPWPKHPCTDSAVAQSGKIKRPNRLKRGRRSVSYTNRNTLYELIGSDVSKGRLIAKFRNISNKLFVRTISLSLMDMQDQGITKGDLEDAPSFIIRKHHGRTIVEFISVRKTTIERLVVPQLAGGN